MIPLASDLEQQQSQQPTPTPPQQPTTPVTPVTPTDTPQDTSTAAQVPTSSPESKKSLAEFGQLIKSHFPTTYDDLDDEVLGKQVLRKYPHYADMVDLSNFTQQIRQSTLPNSTPVSEFQKQLAIANQPSIGKVQVGKSAFTRDAGDVAIPLDTFNGLDLRKSSDMEYADAVTRATWGVPIGQLSELYSQAGLPAPDLDHLANVGRIAKQNVAYAQANKQQGVVVNQKGSTVLLRKALAEGGVAGFNAMAKELQAESAKVDASIHMITPEEHAQVEKARTAVSWKLGVAGADLAQNEYWSNVLDTLGTLTQNPLTAAEHLVQGIGHTQPNLIPGAKDARQLMGQEHQHIQDFYKNQSNLDALIEVLPGFTVSGLRMGAAALAGQATLGATLAGPGMQLSPIGNTIGSILGVHGDTLVQNLDRPLTEQGKAQLINLAFTGLFGAASMSRAVLAKNGIYVPGVIYHPALATAAGLGTFGSLELLSPELTMQQKLAQSIAGGLMPLVMEGAHVLGRRTGPSPIPFEPRGLLGPAPETPLLPETFPIYETKYAQDGYKINLSRPGEPLLEFGYKQGEQIPLFDAVIGGQRAAMAIGKGLQGLTDIQLQEAYKQAGGLDTHMPTDRGELIASIMDHHSSKFPLLEATTENTMPIIEKWAGVERTDTLLETPFQFGKTYQILEEGPGYWKVRDLDKANSIYRIGKYEPAGLSANIENVTSTIGRTLERTLVVPDFTGPKLETQPLIFPEAQATGRTGSTEPPTAEVSRQGAIARLRLLQEYQRTPEYKTVTPEAKKAVKAEMSQITTQLTTPVARSQMFIPRPQAKQHLANLQRYTKSEGFKGLDPQYQDVVQREISDLDFLLNGQKPPVKGSPEEIAAKMDEINTRAAQLYEPIRKDVGKPVTREEFPIQVPTNFIEKSVVETIADAELTKTPPTLTPEHVPAVSTIAPDSSPMWRAVSKAPTPTLADIVTRAGGDATRLSRSQLELSAFDLLGGKRSEPKPSEPGFISAARDRVDSYRSGQQLGSGAQIFDQALVYAYDYLYKPGMRFLDFSQQMIEKFGDEIGPRLSALWEQVQATPRKEVDLTEKYQGADTKYAEVLGQVPEQVLPREVGVAEQIGLAADTAKAMIDNAGIHEPMPVEKVLYPEDWTQGVDTTPAEVASKVSEITTNNRIVSKETYDLARSEIRATLHTMQAGVSPRQLRAMSVVMAYHVENGYRKFGSFARKATELFGDVAKENMYDLYDDTNRYIDLYAKSPVLNRITQLPGGKQLGAVIAKASAVSFSGVDAFRRTFSLANRSPQAREIGDLISRQNSIAARNIDILKTQLSSVHRWAERLPKATQRELSFAMDEGQERALLDKLDVPADIKVLINEMRTKLSDMRNEIRSVAPNALETVVENYFPRLYKYGKQYGATQLVSIRTGRPLETAKTFLKARTIDSMRTAVEELGFEPQSENFVDNFTYKVTEMEKFVQMKKVVDYMRGQGYEKVVNDAKVPAGYKVLNDPVSKILEKVEGPNGEVSYKSNGTVRVYPAAVADLINAHLAPSLHAEPAFRAWNAFTNWANNFQLFGLFHLALVSIDATTRLPSIGVKSLFDSAQHLYHGETKAALGAFGEGMKAIGTGILAPVGVGATLLQGTRMANEWNNPGSQASRYAKRVQFLQEGGVQLNMEGHLQTSAIEGIIKNIRTVGELINSEQPAGEKLFGTATEVAKGVAKVPFVAIEAVMRPVMGRFVPRAKMGVQYYLAGYEMSRMGSQARTKDVRRTMAKIRDVTDDTLGQLNYGNLHMHKATKEVLMSFVRAAGFQIGSERTAYMPFVETAKFAKDVVTPGARAEFTHRMAYMLALPGSLFLTNGLIQMMLSKYNTGNALDVQPKDLVAFRTGRKDQNGDDERWYLPNYFTKEMYPVFSRVAEGRLADAAHEKATMISHKLNPGLNMAFELWDNKDFYGRYINDPNSPQPAWSQYGDFALEQLKPFFLRNAEMAKAKGQTDFFSKYGSFFGPTPAPQYINASTAEDVMMGILKEHFPKAGKSKDQYDRGVLKRKYMNQWKQANLVGDEKVTEQLDEEITQAVRDGKITIEDKKAIYKGVDKTRTQEMFTRLAQQNLNDAIRIYESWMSPEERKLVVPTLRKALGRVNKLPLSADQKQLLLQKLEGILDRDQKLDDVLDQEEQAPVTVEPPSTEPNT